MRNLANFHKLKNSDFILESKMAELNQNKNSKQLDRPYAVRKVILPWKQMNTTINKTFYTCSIKSLLLRNKKISKKAVKIGGFPQCSVHIFLRHDDCFWKISLRILWNHIMKNFQVKHCQCDSIMFPKHFLLKALSNLLDLCLADSRILYTNLPQSSMPCGAYL